MAYENLDADREESTGKAVALSLDSARAKADLDQQITTAKSYPRSLKRVNDRCLSLATMTADTAASMMYALPRGGKSIEGPSARMAEVIASEWGNNRSGGRVVGEEDEFVVAEGVFHDLEKNVMVTMHVKRRITNKDGKRYDADMIGVTGNAAASIAHRNAVLKGVPKSFWQPIYLAARKAAIGDIKTLANTRAEALAYVQKMGASAAQVFAALGVQGEQDIDIDKLATLRAVVQAIKNKEQSIDEAFPPIDTTKPQAKGKPETKEPQKKAANKPVAKKDAPNKPAKPLSVDRLAVIKDKLNEEGVNINALFAAFEVGSTDEFGADQYKDILAKIDDLSSAGT